MLTFLVFRLLAGWFTFFLPSYSSFKALRKRPLNEQEIEKWVTYWIVIGAIVAFEYTAEWLFSWFPFYWEFKTLLLLYLSLPQFEGSTYVYKTYVEPYLVQNESDIDASIASARNETLQFVQTRLSALWDILYSLLSKTPVASSKHSGSPSIGTTPNGSHPILGQGALFQSMQDLWGAIGAPSLWAAPAQSGIKPAISRSTSDTRVSETSSPAVPASTSSTVGYDVGETIDK